MKSVAVLGLFVIMMAGVSAYSMNRRALAQTNLTLEDPKCTIYFDPEMPNVAVDEAFTVTVLVDDVKDLWGYEIGLKFDRSVLEYVGAESPYWKFVSGQIEYLFWVVGATPQNGEVELVEFAFKGKDTGTSPLSFYVHKLATIKYWEAPKDYIGWPIAHTVSEGLVTVS